MSTVNVFWLILFCVATLVFFSVAGTLIFFGFGDLKSLLSKPDKEDLGKKNDG